MIKEMQGGTAIRSCHKNRLSDRPVPPAGVTLWQCRKRKSISSKPLTLILEVSRVLQRGSELRDHLAYPRTWMEKVRHISATTSSSSFRSRLALCGVFVCRYVRVRMPATPVTSGVIVVYFSFFIFSFFLFSHFSVFFLG